MLSRDYRDIISGGALCVAGLWISWFAASHYSIGSPSQMGSGMFPAALGIILAGFGVLILGMALFRRGNVPTVAVRPALAVLASVAVFAASIDRFGMFPTIWLSTAVAALADSKLSVWGTVLLACALGFTAYLIFCVGLGMPIPAFGWSL